MAEVIHHTQDRAGDSSGMGMVLGLILFVIVAALFFLYGLPYVANVFQGPQVNVPSQVDVNVKTPAK